MGWNDFKLPIPKPLLLTLLVPLALLGLLPAVIAFVVVQRKRRYAAECPYCLTALELKPRDARGVKSTWGGAQYFDANGQRLSNARIVRQAGKWLLAGIACLGGIALLVVLAGLALQKAGSFPKTGADNSSASRQPSESKLPALPQTDTFVSAVRNSVMARYNTTTIGKAFEATFTDSRWESGETNKGARVVEFTGKLPQSAYQKPYEELRGIYRDCVARWGEGPEHCVPVPDEKTIANVKFQWTFTADGHSFELTYVDTAHWSLILSTFPTTDEILAYVYK